MGKEPSICPTLQGTCLLPHEFITQLTFSVVKAFFFFFWSPHCILCVPHQIRFRKIKRVQTCTRQNLSCCTESTAVLLQRAALDNGCRTASGTTNEVYVKQICAASVAGYSVNTSRCDGREGGDLGVPLCCFVAV